MKTDYSLTERPAQKEDKTNSIPILNERYEFGPESTTKGVVTKVPATNRNNPFLPYDTLEKLAAERLQFQQQLAEFDHYFDDKNTKFNNRSDRIRQPCKIATPDTDTTTESIRELIRTTTKSVMTEYSSEIEMEVFRRVKTKLLGTSDKDLTP